MYLAMANELFQKICDKQTSVIISLNQAPLYDNLQNKKGCYEETNP
jgi:hypothetical protein